MSARSLLRMMRLPGWSRDDLARGVDHRSVVDQVREDSGWSSHFAVMTLLSAGIAILGLLLSSPAVVIGAMLISPLMGPIIGVGFALATFDAAEIRRTVVPLLIGVAMAVLFCAMIVLVSPLKSVTSEIASRTRPNLFDLLVALFSGLAGTYAMIRGRQGAIVGVAIATALMPPLAVMGFGIATSNWSVLGGSALLFFTNLMTIAVAAAVLARLYGFAPGLSPHQTRMQATLMIVTLIALAIPLGLALRQIAWESLATSEVADSIGSAFPKGARLDDVQIDYDSTPVEISATVLTPQLNQSAEALLNRHLPNIIGKPIELSLDQIRTEHASDADQISTSGVSAAKRNAAKLAERIALVAGVPVENVLIDRVARRVSVRAAPLAGAELSAYRSLEARVAATDRSWSVALVPPPIGLPSVDGDGAQPGSAALETAIWAAKRLGLGVAVTGGHREEAERIADALRKGGVDSAILRNEGRADRVELRWLAIASPAPPQAGPPADSEAGPSPAGSSG